MLLAWAAVLVSLYYRMALYTNLWVLIFIPILGLLALALVATSVALVRARRDAIVLGVVLLTASGCGLIAWTTDWNDAHGRTRFALERSAFDQVVVLMGSGALRPGDSSMRQGALPPHLAHLSITGEVWELGRCRDGQPVILIPALTGFPDGAQGWMHRPCGRYETDYLDANGNQAIPQFELGAGWWWLQ